jgi:beta-lactam-binding protein with PASTA domain
MMTWLLLLLLYAVPQQTVVVPKVVGLSYEHAKARLHARGLQVGNVVPGHCDRPVGAVCRQNPQAGRKVDITEPVHLIVSRGPEPKR